MDHCTHTHTQSHTCITTHVRPAPPQTTFPPALQRMHERTHMHTTHHCLDARQSHSGCSGSAADSCS